MEKQDIDLVISARRQERRQRFIGPLMMAVVIVLILLHVANYLESAAVLLSALGVLALMNGLTRRIRTRDLLPLIERQISRDPEALEYFLERRR